MAEAAVDAFLLYLIEKRISMTDQTESSIIYAFSAPHYFHILLAVPPASCSVVTVI